MGTERLDRPTRAKTTGRRAENRRKTECLRGGPTPIVAIMTQPRVLVTGSAGHLGDALSRVLRGRGYPVAGLDVLGSPSTTVTGSITDRELVRSCLDGVSAVLHTATLHKPHVGSHSQQDFLDTNVTGTHLLAEEAAAAGVGSFVFTSRTSAFGRGLTPAAGGTAGWFAEEVAPLSGNTY